MRALWSGGISFGLIFIPVRLYTASRENTLDFDLLHKKDMARVGYAKICKEENKEIEQDEIVRGFQIRKGEYVVMEDEDFENANVTRSKSIEIMNFTDADKVESKYFEKPYFIEPEEQAAKTYALLHEVLKKTNKVGVARFVLRNREHLAVVKPEEKYLLLEQIRFSEELLEPEGLVLPGKHEFNKEELGMATELVQKMSKDFKPGLYKDTYNEELKAAIEEKALHKKVSPKGKVPAATQMKDLMASLKKSLSLAK